MVLEHGGSRTRTVDEHMFAAKRGTMRVQLFTGPGLRPVAVVTQTNREGCSLSNGAEGFVEEVWQRLCPDEAEPPLFIAHQLLGDEDFGFKEYRFAAAGPYTVERPVRWGPMLDPAELAELVGGPVDAARGAGYVEPEPVDEGQLRYVVTAVVRLPRPDLHGEPPCMPAGTPWWRRLVRQVVPRRRGRNCCWYHQGDWRVASATAIRAWTRAGAVVVEVPATEDDEIDEQVFVALDLVRDASLDEWAQKAAESLIIDPIQPGRADDGGAPYVNGRHRSQAMLDAGVRQTLVAYWDWPAGFGNDV